VGAGGSATIFDTDSFSNGAITLFGDDSDVVFAYQAFAGVRFDLNERMSLGIRYKYFATEDSSYRFDSSFGPPVRLGIEGVRTHLVTVSFNLKF
jgi:opacity protein-like surface antigen